VIDFYREFMHTLHNQLDQRYPIVGGM